MELAPNPNIDRTYPAIIDSAHAAHLRKPKFIRSTNPCPCALKACAERRNAYRAQAIRKATRVTHTEGSAEHGWRTRTETIAPTVETDTPDLDPDSDAEREELAFARINAQTIRALEQFAESLERRNAGRKERKGSQQPVALTSRIATAEERAQWETASDGKWRNVRSDYRRIAESVMGRTSAATSIEEGIDSVGKDKAAPTIRGSRVVNPLECSCRPQHGPNSWYGVAVPHVVPQRAPRPVQHGPIATRLGDMVRIRTYSRCERWPEATTETLPLSARVKRVTARERLADNIVRGWLDTLTPADVRALTRIVANR